MPEKPTIGKQICHFYCNLSPDFLLPDAISIMHPYHDHAVQKVVKTFYKRFYGDHHPRILLLGINPGRFGAGITGVSFTDPIRLEEHCGIKNHFLKKQELSSVFIYDLIKAYGGVEPFYRQFFISSICPLGFTRNGKNLNYYDNKTLQQSAEKFILKTLLEQKKIMHSPDVCLCLGEGTNYRYFCQLNEKHHLFSQIIPLPHPRWVMQYKRKQKEAFIELYLKKMEEALSLIKINGSC